MPDGQAIASRSRVGHPAAARSNAIATLPNLISFARLCAVPVTVWLVLHRRFQPAFWLFVAAGLSDALDGWLARRGRTSRLGAMLDPLADKVLLTTIYVALAAVKLLPDWLAILVVFRDAVIVGGIVLMSVLGQVIVIAPLRISKANTALQIALVAYVLVLSGFGWPLIRPPGLVLLLVAVVTLLSGAKYVYDAARAA